jgi:hypothetical protein
VKDSFENKVKLFEGEFDSSTIKEIRISIEGYF